MKPSTSSFSSRISMPNRQARVQSVLICPTSPSSSLNASGPLNIILEEGEVASSSRTSPVLLPKPSGCERGAALKSKRRHAAVSHLDLGSNDFGSSFICPRPTPSPSVYSQDSPEAFELTFTEIAAQFPHPPTPPGGRSTCASPAPSNSDLSSSPAHSTGMPLTPTTSDDEFLSPPPRCTSIKPLVINKRSPKAPSVVEYDSEPDSDSEWYNNEFSQHLSLSSYHTSTTQHPSRPESMLMSPHLPSRRRASIVSRRDSMVLPAGEAPFVAKRTSKTKSFAIPKYPPPPVPPVPGRLRCALPTTPRPPPRFSVPADYEFEVSLEAEDGNAAADDASEFSFSMYEIDFGDREVEPVKERLSVIQEGAASDCEQEANLPAGISFDMDHPLELPLSLPATPIDLEADIASGLERLRVLERSIEENVIFEEAEFVVENGDDEVLEPVLPTSCSRNAIARFPVSPGPTTPSDSARSFSPAPSPLSCRGSSPYARNSPLLKSKWSTSTLGSVHDQPVRDAQASKLKLYFNGKRSSSHSKKLPTTPTSPSLPTFTGLISPRKTKFSHSPTTSPSPTAKFAHKRKPSTSTHSNSDVLVIGYGVNGVGTGMKKRGSVVTVSDAGSDGSARSSNSSSAGLKRKPIPVEMFLRNVA